MVFVESLAAPSYMFRKFKQSRYAKSKPVLEPIQSLKKVTMKSPEIKFNQNSSNQKPEGKATFSIRSSAVERHRQYMFDDVNICMTSILEELELNRPSDPVAWLVEYLCNLTGNEPKRYVECLHQRRLLNSIKIANAVLDCEINAKELVLANITEITKEKILRKKREDESLMMKRKLELYASQCLNKAMMSVTSSMRHLHACDNASDSVQVEVKDFCLQFSNRYVATLVKQPTKKSCCDSLQLTNPFNSVEVQVETNQFCLRFSNRYVLKATKFHEKSGGFLGEKIIRNKEISIVKPQLYEILKDCIRLGTRYKYLTRQ